MTIIVHVISGYLLYLVDTGAGMGGAVLETLAQRGCKGMFSSHLHHLKYLPLKKANISNMQMEIGAKNQKSAVLGKRCCPTWKVIRGQKALSDAFACARIHKPVCTTEFEVHYLWYELWTISVLDLMAVTNCQLRC